MRDQTVWVTGARGFIGQGICRILAGDGARVHGIGHGACSAAEAAAAGLLSWTCADIAAEGLDSVLARSGAPDVVFHLAGGSSVRAAENDPAGDFERTVTATAELLEWLDRAAPRARTVLISSAAVYGDAVRGPIPEASPPNPMSAYGRHKLMMEDLGRSHAAAGQLIAIARLFSVYGAGLKKQLLWDLSCRLATAPDTIELGGSGEELRDWTHVEDVCRAVIGLATAASPDCPAVNVGTGVGVPVKVIAAQVIAAWPSLAGLAFSGRSRAGDPFSLVADTTALAALGLRCQRPAADGVRDYVAWSRAELERAR